MTDQKHSAPDIPVDRPPPSHYRLFGGVLRSDVEFPGLERVRPQEPRWTLTRHISDPPTRVREYLGSDEVNPEVSVRLYRIDDGYRLEFDDTGTFDLRKQGRSIEWFTTDDVSLDDARADLTSRVLAVALHASGTLSLHGSAVVLEDQAIGFIAPKRHGKSTLTFAMLRGGARLLTDDTLPVEGGDPPIAYPGLHAARLRDDSADRVAIGTPGPAAAGKRLFGDLPPEVVTHESARLHVLYLLSPVGSGEGVPPVARILLSPVRAALVLIGQAKLGPLLGASESATLFRRAAGIAERVPVYRLEVARDLDRLPEVVAILKEWSVADTLTAGDGQDRAG